jgi:hypothetical protein
VSCTPPVRNQGPRPEPARTGRGPSPARCGSVTKSGAGRPFRARSAGHRDISRPPTDTLTPADPLLNNSRHRHSRPPSKGWLDGLSDHPFSGLSIQRRAVLPGVSMSRGSAPDPGRTGLAAPSRHTPAACAARGAGSPSTPSPTTGTAPIGWRPRHAASQHAGTKAQLKAAEEP